MIYDPKRQPFQFRLEKMSITLSDNKFLFSLKNGYAPLRKFRFISYQSDGVQTSIPNQNLQDVFKNGGSWINSIPVRENDAVLTTALTVPSTWASRVYPIRLILGGLIMFEWEITFQIAMFPFHLSGSWKEI